MSPSGLLDHLLNFAAPAFFVALVLALFGRFLLPGKLAARAWWQQLAINFIAGVLVLVAGLVLFGRDGRVVTYAALVVVCGTLQWALRRGKRR
jgi:hypothetical protein